MKKTIKLALIAAFLAVGCFIALTQKTSQASAAVLTESRSPRTLYVQNCARCHGANGTSTPKGQAMDAPDLAGSHKSTATVTRVVKNGKGDMPAFGKKLTAKQIAAIAGYVHSL